MRQSRFQAGFTAGVCASLGLRLMHEGRLYTALTAFLLVGLYVLAAMGEAEALMDFVAGIILAWIVIAEAIDFFCPAWRERRIYDRTSKPDWPKRD